MNDPFFSWMNGLEATKLHGQILVVAMVSAWTAHLALRSRLADWQVIRRLPAISLREESIEGGIRLITIAGAVFQVFLALSGYLGYFVRQEYLLDVPDWLDSAKKLIALANGCLFLLVVSDFQRFARSCHWSKCLILLWVLSGLFTGFKSSVVMPVLFLVIGAWMSQSLKPYHLALLIFVVVMAYTVVEPLREAKNENHALTARVAMVEVLGSESFGMMQVSDVMQRFSRRIDITTTGVQTLIAFEQGRLSEYQRRLDEYFRLFPVMAFVPRAFWSSKPKFDIGGVLYESLHIGAKGTAVTPSVIVTSFIWGGWIGLVMIYGCWGATCTMGGQIIANTRHSLLKYAPFVLFAGTLSTASDIMSVSYIAICRMFACLALLYVIGFLRRPNSPSTGEIPNAITAFRLIRTGSVRWH